MTQPSEITVSWSLPGLLGRVLLLPLGVAAAVWPLAGVGVILMVAVTAAAVLGGTCLIIAAIRQRPRVCLTPEGFTHYKLFGSVARQWGDIDGPFTIIKIGLSKAVAYRLAADYKARVGTKPTSHLSGYDEAIVGVFAISAEELGALLNEHQRQSRG